MNDSKEVIILVIMILVVLVSAAKAGDESLPQRSNQITENIMLESVGLGKEYIENTVSFDKMDKPLLEVGVVSTSSVSRVEDDYGFFVTITTLF